jgi:hypothetical protein
MKKHFKYLSYVIRHKWFVFLECCKYGIPLRGILHDMSKFKPCEWFPYVESFYGGPHKPLAEYSTYEKTNWWGVVERECKETIDANFSRAWLHHQHCNPHHWQYWILRNDSDSRHKWLIQSYSDISEYYLALDGRKIAMFADFEKGDPKSSNFGWNEDDHDNAYLVKQLLEQESRCILLSMPRKHVLEMVADWRGAGRAQGHGDDLIPWYEKNKLKMVLHPDTRLLVEALVYDRRKKAEELPLSA